MQSTRYAATLRAPRGRLTLGRGAIVAVTLSTLEGEVLGREPELASLTAFLASVTAPAALVLEGPPGIGKSTLWHAGVALGRERLAYQTLVCRPVEVEGKLGYAGLCDLLEPVLERTLPALSDPQRRALEVAFLRSGTRGVRTEPRAVGTGLLNVLRVLAVEGTVLIAVDDLQWLDAPSARALAFAVRRLEREPIALLVSRRLQPDRTPSNVEVLLRDLAFEVIEVGPLSLGEFRELLDRRLGFRGSASAVTRIHRLSGGNPFYGLEIARSLTEEGMAEASELPVPDSLLALVGARIARLPPATRRALLAASALETPTVAVIAAATGRSDGRVPALAAAEAADVVRVADEVVRFTHPLLAAAVYQGVPPLDRRRLHRRLSRLVSEVEEQAKHLSLAVEGTDANVAQLLDLAARHAYDRGASEEAAELAERSWRFTPPALLVERCLRQIDAASYRLLEGDGRRARRLLEDVVSSAPPGVVRGRALHALGRITTGARVARELHERARSDAGDDVALKASIERSLTQLALGDFDPVGAERHADAALVYAERDGDGGLRAAALMDVARARFQLGHGMPTALMDEARGLESLCPPTPTAALPSMGCAVILHWSGEIEAARPLYESLVSRARAHGDEPSLSRTLTLLSELECFAGEYAAAAEHAFDAADVARRAGLDSLRAGATYRLALADAYRGRTEQARAATEEATYLADRTEALHTRGAVAWVMTFLEVSLGRHDHAVECAAPFAARMVDSAVAEPLVAFVFLPDLIEALVATGDLGQAAFFTDALERRGQATRRPWALATGGRCRGLVHAATGRSEAAAVALEHALRAHELLPMPFERARTLLVHGAVLRRAKRRRAARGSLEAAHAVFERLGAPLWAARSQAELARIGGRASTETLTPTEAQVAARAAAGETNREIAAALFMSVKTVEANLSRVYRKLDISSRRQLDESLKQQT